MFNIIGWQHSIHFQKKNWQDLFQKVISQKVRPSGGTLGQKLMCLHGESKDCLRFFSKGICCREEMNSFPTRESAFFW